VHRQVAVLGTFSAGLLLGSLLSATVLWLGSGLFSPAPAAWRHVAVVAVTVLCLLRDLGAVRCRLPQNARQIPQEVLQRDLVRGTLQFGFELGTGVRTYVSASLPYALAAGVLLHGGLTTALLAGTGFALGRAATPALRLASGDVAGWDARLDTRLKTVKAGSAAVAALLLAAVLLLPG
jgi:hypothetical protein